MARTIKEWVGKTDDSVIPASVKDRIRDRQDNKCAISGVEFSLKNRPQYDHRMALWLGGKHKESNLQAITEDEHKKKTALEATVRSKVNRTRQKHTGIKRPSSPLSGQKQPKPPSTKITLQRRSLYAPVQERQI